MESPVAEFGLGVDQDGFVDQVLAKEGAVEVRAALEQEAEDVALGEDGENRGKAEASGVVGNMIDLDPERAERGGLRGRGEGPTEDEQIDAESMTLAERTSCEVRGMRRCVSRTTRRSGRRRGRPFGAEDATAVGEQGIVGEDGADAGKDGVAGVAENCTSWRAAGPVSQ